MNRNQKVLVVLACINAVAAIALAAKELFGPGVSSGPKVIVGISGFMVILLILAAAKAGPRKPG